jgi:hypothetical protein
MFENLQRGVLYWGMIRPNLAGGRLSKTDRSYSREKQHSHQAVSVGFNGAFRGYVDLTKNIIQALSYAVSHTSSSKFSSRGLDANSIRKTRPNCLFEIGNTYSNSPVAEP